MPVSFNFPAVSFLQFWLTFGVLFLVIISLALYLTIFVWLFGKPMRKYLTARLAPNTGIIQEFTHETLNIHLAQVDTDEFTDLERKGYFSEELAPKSWYHKWFILRWIFKPGKIYHSVKPLTSKSTVLINGVKTLLVWNVTPPLPERYTIILKELITLGYKSISDVEAALKSIHEGKIIELDDLIGSLETTYKEFLQLHEVIANKNTIVVTPSDILSFNEKYLDEHPKKSVIEKEITAESKRRSSNTYQKYAFYIIAIEIIGGFLIIAYKLNTGGK